jgi:hypothetical protein
MKINKLFIGIFLIAVLSQCSKNKNSNVLVFRAVDTLLHPIPGANIILLEQGSGLNIRKDSGITNTAGCVSFSGLSADKLYSAITLSFFPHGYVKLINSSIDTILTLPYEIIIRPGERLIFKTGATIQRIQWGKFDTTSQSMVPPIHDTTFMLNCGDTIPTILHL